MPKASALDLLSRSRREMLHLVDLAQASAAQTPLYWHTPGCFHLLMADGGGSLHVWHCDSGMIRPTDAELLSLLRQVLAGMPADYTVIAVVVTTHEQLTHRHYHGCRQTIVTGTDISSRDIFNSASIFHAHGRSVNWSAVPPQETPTAHALILAAQETIHCQWNAAHPTTSGEAQ